MTHPSARRSGGTDDENNRGWLCRFGQRLSPLVGTSCVPCCLGFAGPTSDLHSYPVPVPQDKDKTAGRGKEENPTAARFHDLYSFHPPRHSAAAIVMSFPVNVSAFHDQTSNFTIPYNTWFDLSNELATLLKLGFPRLETQLVTTMLTTVSTGKSSIAFVRSRSI